MGRGKRNERSISPRVLATPADSLSDEERERIDVLAERRLNELAAVRQDGRYYPALPGLAEISDSLRMEVAYQLDRIGKASIENAEELVQARFAEAGIELLGSELVDGRFHAEDRAYVQVKVRYDDMMPAWDLARQLSDEMDPEELSGPAVQCGDLSGEEYMARVLADGAALAGANVDG